ncbi:hypothetical protein L6164_033812 [Bauhinia variegata]|nr:hypothetical protein L6164_033812 [Bauhinia variegata]
MEKRRAGRKKFHETRHPIYKGVRKRNGKWVCELRLPNKKSRLWLGTFAHPDMAAIAYDVAALAFRGDSASLNFPNAATSLPRLDSSTSSVRAIQFAAMEAAEKHLSDRVAASSSDLEYDSVGCMEMEMESRVSEVVSEAGDSSINGLFWDEEEVFNMPALIDSMAEGLITTPPALQRGFNWVEMETAVDLTLWG